MQLVFLLFSQTLTRLAMFFLSLVIGGMVTGCKRNETFPDIGMNLPSPTDVASDKTGGYFYVLNADYPRDYNVGSIVTMTSNGDKTSAVITPRLGRSLTRAGDDLIVTYSASDDDHPASVQLFSLANPAQPVLVKEFAVDGQCRPNNAVARDNYNYFAVSCANGMMMVGELKTPRSESTLGLVRNYPGSRRAMHINVARNLLIAFPTDLSEQTWSDAQKLDQYTYKDDDIGVQSPGPNGIPDEYEDNRVNRSNKDKRGAYQYVVYDFAAAAAKGFPYKEGLDVQPELHWVYFNLLNFDGTPDVAFNSDNPYTKYYRTNFWQAQPDLETDDTFYLSHRGYTSSGRTGSPHANSIIKVQIIGDVTSTTALAEETLSYQRVYGFKGELSPEGRYYPTGFQIQQVRGQPLLLVNNFRDLINFPNQYYFSLAAKVLGSNSWFTEKSTTDVAHSYYQVALTPSGRGMAISFYGNVAILLDAFPGTDINEIKTIQ